MRGVGGVDHLAQRAQDLGDAGAGYGREHQRGRFRRALEAGDLGLEVFGRERVGFRERDDLGLVGKPVAVGSELGAHRFVSLAGVLAQAVDEMQQHAAAFDVAKEAVAETDAFMRAFDQARNVGEHELARVGAHHAELRVERGERIIGDLRLCRRHGGEERRLAGVRQPDETGVGDELEAQPDPALLALLPGIGVARRAIGRGLEVRVAEAAIAATRQHHAVADIDEIGDQGRVVLLKHLGAGRHLEHDGAAVGAGAVLAHAVMAALGLEVLLVAIVEQGIEPRHRLDHDIAAAPAVAAVGTAELDELLAAERDAAVPAVAGANVDLGLIEEFHGFDELLSSWPALCRPSTPLLPRAVQRRGCPGQARA